MEYKQKETGVLDPLLPVSERLGTARILLKKSLSLVNFGGIKILVVSAAGLGDCCNMHQLTHMFIPVWRVLLKPFSVKTYNPSNHQGDFGPNERPGHSWAPMGKNAQQ